MTKINRLFLTGSGISRPEAWSSAARLSGGSAKARDLPLVIVALSPPSIARPGKMSGRPRCAYGLPAIAVSIQEDICVYPHIRGNPRYCAPCDAETHWPEIQMTMMSPCRVISIFVRLRTGDLAWHSAARKALKSCSPTSHCAADRMVRRSSG